jgi:flagellar basal-body rod protein FlgB
MNIISGENWFSTLQRALDVLSVQHGVTANNLANVNTPAFTRMQVDFQRELERLLQSGDELELRPSAAGTQAAAANGTEPEISPIADTATPARADGNNVNLEREMVDLAQANQLYAALTRVASKDIQITRYVIREGRG